MLHLKAKLLLRTMPIGNDMLLKNPVTGKGFVDARNISGITIENVISGIGESVRCRDAFSDSDISLRKQIATTVLITMGGSIQHFEGEIDPSTGTVMVDWMFSPIPPEQDLRKRSVTEEDKRIKSHAIIRVYSSHVDPKSGTKFSYLLGSSAIDLASLMQHNIHVNSGLVNADKEHQYDFAIRTNFCNTFVLCTVVPFVHDLQQQQGNLALGREMLGQQKEVQLLNQQLHILRSSLKAYEDEEDLALSQKREPNHLHHSFMPSVLKHLPDVETMVKLQQGLQHVYCSEGIKRADVVLTEANGLAYAQGATYMQTHMAAICFSDVSKMVRSRVAPIPIQQIMVQLYAGMCAMGLHPSDLMDMNDPAHVFEYIKASVAASTMDSKQTPYYSDYIIHSVVKVACDDVALANLQPVPGTVEYAPGCSACIYKQHLDDSSATGKSWFRYVS
jgi:hypothetical protein